MSTKTKNKKKSRYETVKYQGLTGIRRDTKSGSYFVEKWIRGERYNETFDNIIDAADWRKNFHPSLSIGKVENSKAKANAKKAIAEIEKNNPKKAIKKINGNDLGYTFADIWELYKELHLSTIEESSMLKRDEAAKFYEQIMDVKMIHFDAALISGLIKVRKEISINNPKSRRCNCNNDLKNLKAILNWYRENYDEQFIVPILKRHNKEGFIRKPPKKKKKMKEHELNLFFDELEKDDIFWRDLGETQFYIAGRVQDAAGILINCVDEVDESILLENVIVWGNDKKFLYLKDSPKNGEDGEVKMNNKLKEIMRRRLADVPSIPWPICPKTGVTLALVFHIDGEPLSYRQIQYRYNKALKGAGLDHKYSATHLMRHSMANIVRRIADLDTAQVVGRWKTRELVDEVYTDTPTEKSEEARQKVEDLLEVHGGNTRPPRPENPVQGHGLKLVES